MEKRIGNGNKKRKYLLFLLIAFFIFFFVQIAETEAGCCVKKAGVYSCQDTPQTACSGVEDDWRVSDCDSYSNECGKICCIYDTYCATNMRRGVCLDSEGAVEEPADCSKIFQCKEGCCIIGTQAVPNVNWLYCKKITPPGQNIDFTTGISVQECQDKAFTGIGCCIVGSSCTEMKEEECTTGEWKPKRCYDIPICDCSTDMDKGAYFSCLYDTEKKLADSNLWLFDSCSNPIEISKDCNYPNKICGKNEAGEYGCIDLGCIDNKKKKHNHGDSWCEYEPSNYDLMVGDDAIGSTHWLYHCYHGEISMIGCEDKRNQICKQTTPNKGECVENGWADCLSIKDKDKCGRNNQCEWLACPKWPKHKKVDDDKRKTQAEKSEELNCPQTCLPKYPPGLDFRDKSANKMCGKGNAEFSVKIDIDEKGKKNIDEILENVEIKCGQDWDEYKFLCDVAGVGTEKDEACFGGANGATGIDGIKNCLYNAATGSVDSPLKDWVDFMEKRCQALGDCGGSMHFNVDANISAGHLLKIPSFDNGCGETVPEIKLFGISFPPSIFLSLVFVIILIITVVLSFTKYKGHKKKFGPVFICIAAFSLIFFLAGCGVCTERTQATIKFECLPVERHPSGGEVCQSCNADSLKSCSEYRCLSLGSDCKFNENAKLCYWALDTIAPKITSFNVTAPSECVRSGAMQSPLDISCTTSDKCIPSHARLQIKYETDEDTICKYDFTLMDFDEMEHWADTEAKTIYRKKHLYEATPAEIGISLDPDPQDVTLYLRCKDGAGNANDPAYVLKFCISAEPDKAPPTILSDIDDNSYFPYGSTKLNLTVYVDEKVSECRWDKKIAPYEQLPEANKIDGSDFEPGSGLWGGFWSKKIRIPIDSTSINLFHIKCNDTKGNMNQGDYYTIHLIPGEKLNITSIEPKGLISGWCALKPVELAVKTEGGIEEGRANCKYTTKSTYEDLKKFDLTDGISHRQELTLEPGTYTYYTYCTDAGGSEAKDSTTFTVKIDTTPPTITRLYREKSGNLVLHTDEPATCAWGDNCNFEITIFTKNKFAQGNGKLTHTTSWDKGVHPWFVRCMDDCGNGDGSKETDPCMIIIPQDFE